MLFAPHLVSFSDPAAHAISNNARLIVFGLSLLNMGLAAMMGALGVLSLIVNPPAGLADLSPAFLAVYMVIFAALLFCYEFIWWQPVAALNVMFRKNFGFLYGLRGTYVVVPFRVQRGCLTDESVA
jgi:hypothetical protein